MTIKKSVFVVSITYSEGKIKYPAPLKSETIGYYSDLKSAAQSLKSNGPQWHRKNDFAFKIYEIKEYVLNRESDEEVQLRVYDSEGRLHGKYEFKIFRGKDKKDCKFKLGELVQYFDGTYLNVGIITELPPDKKKVKGFMKWYRKIYGKGGGFSLDSSENSYRLFSGYGKKERIGSQECYLFPLSGKIDERVETDLRMRYEVQRQGRIKRRL